MKEFAAFILLIVLVCVGWNQPYRAHFSSVVGDPTPVAAAVADSPNPDSPSPTASVPGAPQATPARDNGWLWNKTSMDAPHSGSEGKGGGKHGR